MNKEKLIKEYISLRGLYFHKYQSDMEKFTKDNKQKDLFIYVIADIDTSFRDIYLTAEKAVIKYINDKNKYNDDTKLLIR